MTKIRAIHRLTEKPIAVRLNSFFIKKTFKSSGATIGMSTTESIEIARNLTVGDFGMCCVKWQVNSWST
jgi:hypothetical protein